MENSKDIRFWDELEEEVQDPYNPSFLERPLRNKLLKGLIIASAGLSVGLGGCLGFGEPDHDKADKVEVVPSPETVPQHKEFPSWPSLEEAKIRPGVRTYSGDTQCTSNFLFSSPDNSTLYLGSAAQCVGKLGEKVDIAGTDGTKFEGEVAYSSGDRGDFALIRLYDSYRANVHPAVLQFGGPTGISLVHVSTGDSIGFYGDSDVKMGEEQTKFHNCFATPHTSSEKWFNFHCLPPGIDGDYGAGVMTPDAEAIGVLTRNSDQPLRNNATYMMPELDGVSSARLPVRLVTWPRLVNV